MKVIKADSPQFAKVFTRLAQDRTEIVVWQIFPDTQKRIVSETALIQYADTLKFKLPVDVTLNPEHPIYYFVEDGQLIFKNQLIELVDGAFVASLPDEFKFLDLPENEKMKRGLGVDVGTKWKTKRLSSGSENLSTFIKPKKLSERSSRDKKFLDEEFNFMSLDEEDKLFADKRESKRVKPKTEKVVRLRLKGQDEPKTYKLFDLSQGGMAFIAYDVEKLPKSSELEILGFDSFNLDDPLYGTIMSHRPVDEAQVEFKIGVKFSEGQD